MQDRYRSAALALVAETGDAPLAGVDTDRVALAAGEEGGESLVVLEAGGTRAEYPISGQGVLGLRFEGRSRALDLPVLRIGEYWCLQPLLDG